MTKTPKFILKIIISLNLAESERDGGVSPTVSPMLSLTDMGNIFSRSGHFNLPTVDITHMQLEFTSTFQLYQFIREVGEQNALLSKRKHTHTIHLYKKYIQSVISDIYLLRKRIPESTFIAAAAIYETLFTKKTIGQRDEYTSSVLIDTLKDVYMNEGIQKRDRDSNIISSLDIIFLIGWKQHESQQKPKERGTAKFSLKDVVQDLNEKEGAIDGEKHQIKYGVIIDDGDEVKEIQK